MAYCPKAEVYALGMSRQSDFKLSEDDEMHPEWKNEGIVPLPSHWEMTALISK